MCAMLQRSAGTIYRYDKIAELHRIIDSQIADGSALGMQVVAARHGQVMLDVALGMARRDPPAPVTHETLFYSWSVVKPVTAMAIHLLIERGQLSLDTPIVKVWSQFGKYGKDRVTVGQVLSHRAGFPILPKSFKWHEYGDWDAAARGMEDAELQFEPGTAVQYHSLTFGWTLGEVVRRVDGRRIEQFAREEFFAPLKMNNSYLKIGEEQLASAVELSAREDWEEGVKGAYLFNQPFVRFGVIPAAGMHTTARDLARFYQMLLNGGELEGVCVLSAESILRARTRASRDGERERDTQWLSHRAYGFSLGGHADSVWGGERGHPTAFGHSGWATNTAFADPGHDLVCAVLNNFMLPDADNHRRLRAICDKVVEACED